MTTSAVIYCLRCFIKRDIPLNQGCLNPIEIILPEGTLLSSSETAAVVGGLLLVLFFFNHSLKDYFFSFTKEMYYKSKSDRCNSSMHLVHVQIHKYVIQN